MTSYTTDFYFKYPGNGTKASAERGRSGFRQEEYNCPWFLDTSPAGDLIVADTDNHRVQILDGNTKQNLYFPCGQKGSEWGELRFPKSAKYSPFLNSHLVIADSGNGRLVFVRLRPDGFVQEARIIGQGLLRQPSDIVLDGPRNLIFVSDTTENSVIILTSNGDLIGRCGNGPLPLNQPTGIAQNPANGQIYVCDTGNNCIQVFGPNGDYLRRIGERGSLIGQFNSPKGICSDKRGRLFVADQLNDRVIMLSGESGMMSEVVKGVPHPKGVAAHDRLFVTTADPYSIIKTYTI